MAGADDWSRLQQVATSLPPAEAAWLLETYGPRCYRVRLRDDLIRETAARFFPGLPTVVAKGLARALTAYRASNWQWEQQQSGLPETADERHRALHGILRLNGGRALCWRAIVDLL